MKSFHLSGPKFDIAVEMFCMVKFLNFLLGQKFVTVKFENAKIGPKKANFAKGTHLFPCQTAPTHQSLTLFWMEVCINETLTVVRIWAGEYKKILWCPACCLRVGKLIREHNYNWINVYNVTTNIKSEITRKLSSIVCFWSTSLKKQNKLS